MAPWTNDDVFGFTWRDRMPDRRWRKIARLVRHANSRLLRRVMRDPRASQAYRFACKLSDGVADLTLSPESLPEIAELVQAWQISSFADYQRTKNLIEACCYAKLPPTEIAGLLQLSPGVVDWYVYLFHDIAPFLAFPSLIITSEHLLGRLLMGQCDSTLILKVVAFKFGVETMFRLADGPGAFIEEDWQWVDGAIRQKLAINAWSAALASRSTQDNAVKLADMPAKLTKETEYPSATDMDSLAEGLEMGLKAFGEQ